MSRLLRSVTLVIVLAWLATGCTPGVQPEEGLRIVERTKCHWSSDANISSERKALECAKAFVVLNGYTAQPAAADTLLLAFETFERGSSWLDLLAQRRGTLESDPIGICQGSEGWTITFAPRGVADSIAGRGVTMSLNYDALVVQHTMIDLTSLREHRVGCKPSAEVR